MSNGKHEIKINGTGSSDMIRVVSDDLHTNGDILLQLFTDCNTKEEFSLLTFMTIEDTNKLICALSLLVKQHANDGDKE